MKIQVIKKTLFGGQKSDITIINYLLFGIISFLSVCFYVKYGSKTISGNDFLVSGNHFLIGNLWLLSLGVFANYMYAKEKKYNTKLMSNLLSGEAISHQEAQHFEYQYNASMAKFFKRMYIKKNIAEKDNHDIRENFSKLVPAKILKDMGKDISGMIDVGMSLQKKLHIMFIDISGFTHMSESIPAEKALKLLNVYFNGIVDIGKANGGYVDKFLGDGIMLVFDQEKSDHALTAAVEIRQLIHQLNLAGTYENIDIGVGINTGIATLGTIGSRRRMDITIIGDSVNVAARLEQLTREQKEWIIIGEETHAMLSDAHQFQIKDLGEVSLKGRDKKINIYGVGD